MRRLLLAATALVVLGAVLTIWRMRHAGSRPRPPETVGPAPLPARAVNSTSPPPAPPQRTVRAATPLAAEPETTTNEARFRALHEALVTTTLEAARLYSDFAKAGVTTPPQARTFVQMKQRGASRDDLVAYVRTSFPNDVIARAVVLRWLDAGSGAHLSPDTSPFRALGELLKRDAN